MRQLIQNTKTALPFLKAMLRREIKSKYQQSLVGFVWLLIQPMFLLLIYYFVFSYIFKVRFDVSDGDVSFNYSFLTFLVIGLWPWSAFSEGINAATGSIDKHKSVLQKIALPSQLLVFVEVLVPYIIHGIGFLFVLIIVVALLGNSIAWFTLPIVFFIFCLQCLFTIGLGLIFSSLQVFLKDVSQFLQPLLMMLFYGSTILYSPTIKLPENLQKWLAFNPLSSFINSYRALLLDGQFPSLQDCLSILFVTIITFFIGHKLFKRLSVKFEDLY